MVLGLSALDIDQVPRAYLFHTIISLEKIDDVYPPQVRAYGDPTGRNLMRKLSYQPTGDEQVDAAMPGYRAPTSLKG